MILKMNKIMKNRILFFFFFLMGLLLSGNMYAQVSSVRSKQITTISGKEYYMHHVKQGETLWGLSKAYNISVEEIEALNPEVKNGLKAGHVLGIPVRPEAESQTMDPEEEAPKSVVVETKPEPKVEEPKPEPVVVEPEPVVTEPEPKPVVVEPKPQPKVEEPKPEPVVVEPKPVVVEPKPEPVAETPKVVKPQSKPKQSDFFDGKARIVQSGETLYDIAKEYGIDIVALRAANPGISDEPAVGTRVNIPDIVNENDYIIHNCERNERVSSLLKRWKVDENDFRRMNVSVGSHVFVNQVVLIPIQPVSDFYWIDEMSGDVVENEEEQPSEETVITIQEEAAQSIFNDDFEASEQCTADPQNAMRRYKVALMVPLYLNDVSGLDMTKENLPRLHKARSLSFVQYYEGFMMAVETLEREGLRMDLTVIDVTDNVSTAERALSQIRGMDLDLIVGPFFGKSFAVVEEYAKEQNIVVVNPLSTRESVIVNNPNVVKVKPGELGQIMTISNLVKNLYDDANVFIVSKERSSDTAFLNQLEYHLNHAVNDEVRVSGDEFLHFARNESERLEMGSRMVKTVEVEGQVYSTDDFKSGNANEVVLANPVKRYPYSEISKVKSQLSGVRNNVIVAYGDDNVFATQMLNSLAKETDRFPITLVCAPDWAKFEKLLVENLLQMNAIYLGDGFVDYKSEAAKQFVRKFRSKYAAEPQDYAFEGYDMAMFFLSALMRYGDDMMDCLNSCDVPLLHSQFRFFNRDYLKEGRSNGRENQYWSVYQYDSDLIELRPVDPFKKMVE